MAGSRFAAIAATVVLVGTVGCSSDDSPTTGAAGKDLAVRLQSLGEDLADGIEPLQPWQVSDDASKDRAAGCDDGTARRTYAATLVVPDATGQDAEGREAKLLGKLGKAGWDPETVAPTSGDTPSQVGGKRSDGGSGLRVRIAFRQVDGGWRYDVSARTACLQKGRP